jgi:hypothetical protein
MPNQLIALVTQLTAKRASFVSIRHSPGFGIAAQVVGSQLADLDLCGKLLHHVPNKLFGHAITPRFTSAAHPPEELP